MANINRSHGYSYVAKRYVDHNENDSYPRGRGKYRSLSFEGSVLISYSTPIACYHRGKEGLVWLLTNEPYSVTTRSHKDAARYRVKARAFSVPSIGVSYYSGGLTSIDHDANLAHLWSEATEIQEKAIRLYLKTEHDWNIRDWPTRIRNKLEEMLAYQRYVGGDVTRVANFPTSIAAFIDKTYLARDEKRIAFEDPKAVERRARAKARRLLKLALNLES